MKKENLSGILWLIYSLIAGGIIAYIHLRGAHKLTKPEALFQITLGIIEILIFVFVILFFMFRINFTLTKKWFIFPRLFKLTDLSIYAIVFLKFQIELWPRDLIG